MDPALHSAAEQGNVANLRKLIEGRPDILLSTTPQKNTALHIAVERGHISFVEELLSIDKFLLVNPNDDGDTPLHLAARVGKVEMVELLIDHVVYGARWSSPPLSSSSPSLSSEEYLDAGGQPLRMRNRRGDTPLHEALNRGRRVVALKLLAAEPSCGHATNHRKQSPLYLAAGQGFVDVVTNIVRMPWVSGKFEPDDYISGTALHQAVLGGFTRVVEILLATRQEEEMGLTDTSGNNVLHYAAQRNNARVVDLLLGRKPDLAYKRNHELQSPLHVAAYYGSTEAMRKMLTRCSDVVEMVDSNGRSALHVAITIGKVDELRCLLKHVSREDIVNRVDNEGNTPLHLAARLNQAQLGLLLLKGGRANPCVLNRDGQTARNCIEAQTRADSLTVYFWKELKKEESIKCKGQQLPPLITPVWWQDLNQYVQLRMGTYTLVATLIATVTFSSTFTMPGGYDQQDGTAILGHRTAFKLFVIANTLAMLSSIVVVFGFIWARKEQMNFRTDQIAWSHWLTVVACLSMVASLTTSVYLTVEAKSPWLAYIVIAMGCSTPVVMFLMLGKDLFSTGV